jgi:hypothetical protein
METRFSPEHRERNIATLIGNLAANGSVRIRANRLLWRNIIARPGLGTQNCGRSDRSTRLRNCATKAHWREI